VVTLEPRAYSQRLGVIDGAQLQRACDLFDLGTVEQAEPASAGLWGQNIILSTTNGRFVLRGNPQSAQQFSKERVVAAAVNARSSLPVPWPYDVSNDIDLFGWAFAIMPLLPGTMGSTIWEAVDEKSKLDLAAAHGAALAHLHQATFNAPGPYDAQREMFVATDDFRGWTLDRLESLRGQCRAIDALSLDTERYIDRLIESCSDALTEPFVPVLVHHDFSLANTNYELLDDGYRATGVFDLGEAHVGHGEEDLVRFLFRRKRAQREAFVAAYTEERPLRAGAGDRLSLFALADLLFMWGISRRITNWFGDAAFIEIAKPIIENARMAAN
jgi:aminoglycoside phosphotransferase (APT) family kinase protein